MVRPPPERRGDVAARRQSCMASLLSAVFVGQPRLTGASALDPADVRSGDVEKLIAMLRQLERDVKKED